MSEKENMEAKKRASTGANKTVAEVAKITVVVAWKGGTISRRRDKAWWSQLTKEEILSEIEEAIDRIGEE